MRTAIALLLATSCAALGGVAFGVNPIGLMREAYVGFQIGSVVPQVSVNFGNFNGSFEVQDLDYDEVYSGKLNVTMLSPTVGTKFLFAQSDLKPFARIALGIPILTYKLDVDLEDPDEEAAVNDFAEILKEGIGQPLIFSGGVGVEYFFVDRFSIGGELKYSLITAGAEWQFTEDDLTYWNGSIDFKGCIGGTSTCLWLNYYF